MKQNVCNALLECSCTAASVCRFFLPSVLFLHPFSSKTIKLKVASFIHLRISAFLVCKGALLWETIAWDGCLKCSVSVQHVHISWVFLCSALWYWMCSRVLYKINLGKRCTVRLKYTEDTTQYLSFNHIFGQVANIFFSAFCFLTFYFFLFFKNNFGIMWG